MNYELYIAGEWCKSNDDQKYPVVNPLNNEVLAEVPNSSKEDMAKAILRSNEFKNSIKEMALLDKLNLLNASAKLIRQRKETFINLLIKNAGQVRKYATRGVEKASEILENVALQARHLNSEVIKSRHANKFGYSINEPLGTVGVIFPINAPLLLPLTAFSSSFVAGNSTILKPAFETPLPAFEFGKVLHELGFPKGAVSVLSGDAKVIGTEMIQNPGVNGIVFFGSTQVGQAIGSECTRNVKKCVLNLAGKNPTIIMDDADLDKAILTVMTDAYVNAGQICMSMEALYVHEKIFDEFRDRLVEQTKKLKVGDPDDPDTDIGPIPLPKAILNAKQQLDDAVSKGARILTGGQIRGSIIEPTVLENVTPDMDIVVERTSAPFAPLVKIKNLTEAIQFANKSRHNLRSAIFTKNIDNAFKLIHNINAGTVVVNGNTFYMEEHWPHGGINLAGLDGARYFIDELTRRKFVIFHDLLK